MKAAANSDGQQRQRHRRAGQTAIVVRRLVVGWGVLVLAAAFARAGFEVSWYSVDAGGGSSIGASGFSIRGTIAQLDAGSATGGAFSVTGGLVLQTPPGDCNQDGLVDLADYVDINACLGGPAAPWPAPHCNCFDSDGDDDVDLKDVRRFQGGYSYP